MNYRIEFQDRAIKEYQEAARWYKERSEQAADNFSLAVEKQLDILMKDPERFRLVYKGLREVILKKYPYKIIYFLKEKDKIIFIASIFHSKRDPATKFKGLP